MIPGGRGFHTPQVQKDLYQRETLAYKPDARETSGLCLLADYGWCGRKVDRSRGPFEMWKPFPSTSGRTLESLKGIEFDGLVPALWGFTTGIFHGAGWEKTALRHAVVSLQMRVSYQ